MSVARMAIDRIKFRRAIRLAVLELSFVLLALIFVRREFWEHQTTTITIEHWQEWLLLPLSVIDGVISGITAPHVRQKAKSAAYIRLLKWATPTFFFLYLTCSALCERVNFGIISFMPELFRDVGLALVVAGLLFRLWTLNSSESVTISENSQLTENCELAPNAELAENIELSQNKGEDKDSAEKLQIQIPSGPYKLLRYPNYFARLICLIGIALVFDSWLPLFTLPGLIVLMKWQIGDEEQLRMKLLGDAYKEYQATTWQLAPFLF